MKDQTKLIFCYLPVVGLGIDAEPTAYKLQMILSCGNLLEILHVMWKPECTGPMWRCRWLGSKRHRQRRGGVRGSSVPWECGRQNILQGRTREKLECFLHLKEFLVIHYNSIIMNRINIFLAWMVKVLSAIHIQGWEVWDSINLELEIFHVKIWQRTHGWP